MSRGALILLVTLITTQANATELVHQFKNPSFSGVGTSSHYLTIENQERTRREKIKDDIQAALDKAEREADNTTLAKFIRNLESRIYAQFAKQLVESMFSNDNPASFGSFVLEGNTITWNLEVDEAGIEFIRLTIVSSDGTTTEVVIPVGTGNFGQDPDAPPGGDGG